jgi:eukaryotic-like serine/threonine-protein kinase
MERSKPSSARLDLKHALGSTALMPEAPIEDVFGLVGTTLEGRFIVDRVVAEGGFGVVYHAQQAALERPIALKVLKTPKRFDDAERKQFLAGFAAEAKTVARITHPSIVQVFDFGVSPMPSGVQAAWMALEWLTGVTLEDELAKRRGQGGRSPSDCLAVLRPVFSALALVHKEGVAHRDIKPANIMIVKTAVGPTPKLLDFGIAKLMSADEAPGTGHTRTRSNQIAFSPAYAAPEQISQGRSGPWTDVHGMGLVLTEMLTDAMAFEGEEVAVLFQQIVDRARPTPARRGVQIGPWEEVLQRALNVLLP